MDPSAVQTGHEQKKGDINRAMFKAAMSGNWTDVKKEFQTDKSSREAKITSSEDTVVHFAVIEGQRAVVKELIDLLPSNVEKKEILLTRNKRGSTPLHLAAAQGDWVLCEFLARVSAESLIDARNNDGETPLFLAALHGKKEAFFVLHTELKKANQLNQIGRYIRRKDGNTILHVAISGEHFDLAFQIIKMYQDVEKQGENVLVNVYNEKGQSALHVLAKSPHAFRSGYHLGTVQQIIYYLTWVDPLEKKINDQSLQQRRLPGEDDKTIFPENYNTCWNIFKLVQNQFEPNDKCWNFFKLVQNLFQAKGKGRKGRNKSDSENPPPTQPNGGNDDREQVQKKNTVTYTSQQLIPSNYVPLFRFLYLVMQFTLILLGFGFWKIKKIRDRKQRHTWAVQVMNELVQGASAWEYNADGKEPEPSTAASWLPSDSPDLAGPEGSLNTTEMNDKSQGIPGMGMESQSAKDTRQNGRQAHLKQESPSETSTDQKTEDGDKSETSILVASKNGVVEMVEKILRVFPVAIQDENKEGKNIVLLAVEHRQPYVYELLWKKYMKESVFQKVDNGGNSALHLAAELGNNRPWIIPGAALQMQWEIKWYKFVKSSMRSHFFMRLNNVGETAKEIFTKKHRDLVTEGGDWLNRTSESCSVVAALIATVAFAAAVTVPGGVKEDRGTPILEGKPAFDIFAITSLVALCLSVTSLIMFLAILTSRHAARDFEWSLPRKLMIGLTTLFFSIAAILLSFCAGHYFILRNHLRHIAFSMYAVSCLPVLLFAFAQFPLYFDLVRAILTPVPHRTYKETAY
ncbi:uncharacterized protein [Aristolochia californica]|uniref:uncharacterized protein n=1 Tax=Aristolochia californica TaxID=171875 RepID=UPI0035D6ADFE